MTGTDWAAWHREYDDPTSDLSRRLRSVQGAIRDWIARSPQRPLAEQPDPDRFSARLIEIDEGLAGQAEQLARDHGLAGVDVVRADAGVTDAYAGAGRPGHAVLRAGVA